MNSAFGDQARQVSFCSKVSRELLFESCGASTMRLIFSIKDERSEEGLLSNNSRRPFRWEIYSVA